MNRPSDLLLAGALADLVLALEASTVHVLSDRAWFGADAVALALLAYGCWRADRRFWPLAVGWGWFTVIHVVGLMRPSLFDGLAPTGDGAVTIAALVAFVLVVRSEGFGLRAVSALLYAGGLIIPIGIAIGGDAGLRIALPAYSVVLVVAALSFRRCESGRYSVRVA